MIGKYLRKMGGSDRSPPRKPHHKIGWSWLGAFIGIYSLSSINTWLQIDALDSLFLVGSFGATAVLIYGAPQAEFSQPRNLVGGHIISALIGISVYEYLPLEIELLKNLVS